MNSVGQTFAIAATLALLGTTSAFAADMNQATTPSAAAKSSKDQKEQWREMRQETVSAQALLRGEFNDGLNDIANTSDLVLNKDLTGVAYVVFRNQEPPFNMYIGTGYVDFGDVRLDNEDDGSVDATIDTNKKVRGPEDLVITKDEAKSRLVSYIVDEDLKFKDGSLHKIDDLLLSPKTGALMYFVVANTPDTVFSLERRAVPADHVHFQNGMFTSDLTFEQLENMQPYDIHFL